MAAVNPNDGAGNVPITLDTIIIYYNQAMKYDGGGGSVELGVHYRLRNMNNNQSIPIVDISYNDSNYRLTLEFNNNDPDWEYDTPYELWIQASIRNICGTPQGGSVTTSFTTEPQSPDAGNQTSTLNEMLPSTLFSPMELLSQWSCWFDPQCSTAP